MPMTWAKKTDSKTASDQARTSARSTEVIGSPFVNFDRAAEIEALNIKMEKAFQQKSFEQALILARKSLELSAAHYGIDHYEYSKALNNVAWYEQNSGDYQAARKHFEEALKLMEKNLGSDNPKIVPLLNNLSILLAAQGDPMSAAPLLERALLLEEKVVGANSSDLANTLNNLAVIYDAAGLHKQASQALERAYQIQEEDKANCDPVERALTLTNLSLLSQQNGNLQRAEQLMEESLTLRQKTLNQADPDLAESLTNLAMIELQLKKLTKAEEHLKKAISIVETSLSDQHSDLIPILNNLAALEIAQSHDSEARKHSLRAATLLDKHIADVLPGLSFAEQRAFLNSRLASQISTLISTTNSPEQANESYSFLFRWKGLLIETLRMHSQILQLAKNAKLKDEAQTLISLRSKISDLYHRSSELKTADWKKETEELIFKKENLERKIASEGKEASTDILAKLKLQDFCRLLKTDEQLIDIYYYNKTGFDKDARYAAFISNNSGVVRLADLGSANQINQQVKLWLKQTINKENSSDAEGILSSVFLKLCGENVSQSRLLFCADSELNRLPISTFTKALSVTNLDSPRELAYLRSLPADPGNRKFLVVGGADFGNSANYAPLPGTFIEAEKISELAAIDKMDVCLLTGKSASKEAFLSKLPNSERLHIATHGVFSVGTESSLIDDRNLLEQRNPLARSGLVFSASPNDPTGASNIVSAEELVSTNLRSCKSVVLSACETGLGDKENGQGVLGLRAAIMAGGARTLLISLWKVSDKATVLLMDEFYRNVLEKHQGTALALKNAQLHVSQNEEFKSPADWSGWILLGEAW